MAHYALNLNETVENGHFLVAYAESSRPPFRFNSCLSIYLCEHCLCFHVEATKINKDLGEIA
jgi:hypothetical protein